MEALSKLARHSQQQGSWGGCSDISEYSSIHWAGPGRADDFVRTCFSFFAGPGWAGRVSRDVVWPHRFEMQDATSSV